MIKKGIMIVFVISNSAWEPISVSTLFWGKAALVATLAERYLPDGIEELGSAATSRSLGDRGYGITWNEEHVKWKFANAFQTTIDQNTCSAESSLTIKTFDKCHPADSPHISELHLLLLYVHLNG
jgi:hypothetical protein